MVGVVNKNMGSIWDSFIQGIFDYGMSAYDPFGIWKYPLIILGIIGFVYATMESAIVAIIAIVFSLTIYGATTDIFNDVPDINLFMYIITIVGIALLLTVLFIKNRSA